jgi:hypothetical protein
MSSAPHSTLPDLLNAWSSRAVIALDAHYEAACLYSRRHYRIGIPSIMLAEEAPALPDQFWDKARLRHLQAAGELERTGVL